MNCESDIHMAKQGAKQRAECSCNGAGLRGKLPWQLILGAVVYGAGIAAPFSTGTKLAFFLASYALLGWEVLFSALRNIAKGRVFDENLLMTIATAGAFLIGEAPEAAGVMLFYQVGEFCQGLAVQKSRQSITDLMDIRPDSATVEINGVLARVSPDTVRINDIIVVKPGERIPLDGVITEGTSALDTRALTGESVPRGAKPGDEVLSGCISLNGVLRVRVSKTFGESTASKIIRLMESAAGKKTPTENFMTTFSRYYTPAVVLAAAMLAVLPPLFLGGGWSGWINRGLIFLVISCPCALVISIPLGFFGGIGGASRRGVLVKGSNCLEALSKLDRVVFDKTGTLTKGAFQVTAVSPADGFTAESLLNLAAHAEAFSNHPVAWSIVRAFGGEIDKGRIADYSEIPGRGVSVMVDGHKVLAGNGSLMGDEGVAFTESSEPGTKVYVAISGIFAGGIVIADEIKADSKAAIEGLKAAGVKKTVLLTGDNAQIAQAIAKELELDEACAQLLPAGKVEMLERLAADKRYKGKLAFVGDGINDAPVLARADVGVAMGGLGSDAAIEAADVVLMTDEPSKLVDAVKIARYTKKIVWQNIFFALGVKAAFLALSALGVATLWEAVFADVGVALLAVLNAMRIIRRK